MVKENPDFSSSLAILSGQQAHRVMSALFTDPDEEAQGSDAAPESSDVPMPARIDEYLIERTLGVGGGGTVYQGVRKGSDRRVAIKRLHTRVENRRRAERAWRELELMEQVRLPGFPHVYDYGLDDGRLFIVSEHIEGQSLDLYCREHVLTLEDRVRLLIRAAEHIGALHERGIIHRDVKPANILVDESGEPVIIDLGIATLVTDDVTETLTVEGAPIGSPAFMAPEQARGELDAISTRSDVYSMAATACAILTGQPPHDVDAPLHEAIRRVAQDPPRPVRMLNPDLPKPLAGILDRGLAMEPAHRYPSMSEFAADLGRWLSGEPIAWQRPGWIERQRMKLKRNPKAWWGQAAIWLLVVLLIGTTSAMLGFQSLAKQREEVLARETYQRQQAESYSERAAKLFETEQEQRTKAEQLAADEKALRALQEAWARRQQGYVREAIDSILKYVAVFEDDVKNDLIYDSVIETGLYSSIVQDVDAKGLHDEELINRVANAIRDLVAKIDAGEIGNKPDDGDPPP